MKRRKFIEKSLLAFAFAGIGGAMLTSCSEDDDFSASLESSLTGKIQMGERLYISGYDATSEARKKARSFKSQRKVLGNITVSGFIVSKDSVTENMESNPKLRIAPYCQGYSRVDYRTPFALELASGLGRSPLKTIERNDADNKRIIITEYQV